MSRLLRWGTFTAVALGVLSWAATALAATGWTVVSAPATSTNAVIYGASARTDTDVWAVGTAFGTADSPAPPPIAYHWNGSAWSLVPAPNLGIRAGLLAVSAGSATDAWAVGFAKPNFSGYRGNNSLFEHWNGNAWSVVAGANSGGLVGVADLSPTNAWAVSTTGVVEHWDGTAWTTVSTPQPNPSNTFGNRVSSMSADGPSDIWAVGVYTTPSYTNAAYALHYDGTASIVVPMAQPASGTPAINAVTALSPTNAWAVGQTSTEVLAEHWDGTAWTQVPTVSGVQYPSLSAIAARSANDIWAIGSQYTGTQNNLLLLHWDGRSWSSATGPTLGSAATLDAAATTPGGGHVWGFGVGSTNQPLILNHP